MSESPLAARVAELEAALVAAESELSAERERTAAVNEEMQHFVYAVSHDLRQPLRTVMTSAQILHRSAESTGASENGASQEYVTSIIEGAQEINKLVERLLTYSRVASNLRRSNVPLSAVLQWVCMSLGKLITEHRARITHDDLPVMDIDDSAMATVFEQLFTNSILYRGGESPVIHVSAVEGNDAHVITVQDNGVGIAPEFHERVFVPLQRLHGREISGFGLGLPICRKVIRAHGGSIWVESDGTTGTRVHFSVPY